MAWDKSKPANDELLINFPAQCRANWDALEAQITAALKITNAKVADDAGIVDTKLAQIATAGKVSGAALTLLANVPSGAGLLPTANLPSIDGAKLSGLANISAGAGLIPDANMPATLVKLAGDQTVAGIKTFSSIPVLPASNPTTDNQAVRKLYADGKFSKTVVGEINALTEKTTLLDDDIVLIEDSAVSYAKKKVKKSNLVNLQKLIYLYQWDSGDYSNCAHNPSGYDVIIDTATDWNNTYIKWDGYLGYIYGTSAETVWKTSIVLQEAMLPATADQDSTRYYHKTQGLCKITTTPVNIFKSTYGVSAYVQLLCNGSGNLVMRFVSGQCETARRMGAHFLSIVRLNTPV